MTLKSIELTTAEGKRKVSVANNIRKQMYDHIVGIFKNAGLEPTVAANGDIAVPTIVDATTGETYFTRLAVSLSAKTLDSKTEKKAKVAEPVVVPSLFDAE